MKLKRIAAWTAAAVIALSAFASCGTSIIKNEKIAGTSSSDSGVSAVTELSSSTDSQDDTSSSVDDTVVYTQTDFDAVEVPYVEYKKTYQAESGTISGDGATIETSRASFKGDGYVQGADADNWSLSFDLPESQFYNISVQVASDKAVNCRLYINGSEVWVFRATGDGNFETKNLQNIWLSEGINEIKIKSTDSAVDIDYITVEANEDISSLNPDLSDATLSNENADYNAKALYSLLCSNYGKQILTAQQEVAGSSEYSELIAALTGKYPAIRASDIGAYTHGKSNDVSQAKKYAEDGGIVAYDWYWLDPEGTDSIEIADVNFDITKAMPALVEAETSDSYSEDLDEDQQSAGSQAAEIAEEDKVLEIPIEEMAAWTTEEIEAAHDSGEITDECYMLLNDIDIVAGRLKVLKKAGVAVLWRPLPVASNGLYWWGLDKDAYIWLWQLMYTRMTEYHDLTNLVWVWSAQNADWYVGDEYCDVLSVDVYADGNRDAQINTMLFLNNICKTKPLAMSECGNLPAMESVLQEKAFWSYTALWNGSYFEDEVGLTESDESKALLARFKEYYNNNYTLTRDELPNLKDVAKSIKAEEKAAKKAAKNKNSDDSTDSTDSAE